MPNVHFFQRLLQWWRPDFVALFQFRKKLICERIFGKSFPISIFCVRFFPNLKFYRVKICGFISKNFYSIYRISLKTNWKTANLSIKRRAIPSLCNKGHKLLFYCVARLNCVSDINESNKTVVNSPLPEWSFEIKMRRVGTNFYGVIYTLKIFKFEYTFKKLPHIKYFLALFHLKQ